jgi:hypothetical protein
MENGLEQNKNKQNNKIESNQKKLTINIPITENTSNSSTTTTTTNTNKKRTVSAAVKTPTIPFLDELQLENKEHLSRIQKILFASPKKHSMRSLL